MREFGGEVDLERFGRSNAAAGAGRVAFSLRSAMPRL
jgi:hypothetical protein